MSMKPQAMLQAWDRYPDCESLIFVDGDIEIVGSLDPFLEQVSNHNVLLSPHLSDPGSKVADFAVMGRSGSFNAGLWAVSRPGGKAFLEWFEARCQRQCQQNFGAGMIYDQGWLNLVPALFERVGVDRHPGSNIAYWNLADRPLEDGPDGPLAAGQPAQTVHLSGWEFTRPQRLSHFSHGFEPPPESALGKFLQRHHQRLLNSPFWSWQDLPAAFNHFHNGRPIAPILAVVYSDLLEQRLPADHDPYSGLPFHWETHAGRALAWLATRLRLEGNGFRQFIGYRLLLRWLRSRRKA